MKTSVLYSGTKVNGPDASGPDIQNRSDGIYLDYGEGKLIGPYPDRASAEKDAEGLKLTIPINVVTLWAWQERVEEACKTLDTIDEALCQATWERRPKELTKASDTCRAAIKKLSKLKDQIEEARKPGISQVKEASRG